MGYFKDLDGKWHAKPGGTPVSSVSSDCQDVMPWLLVCCGGGWGTGRGCGGFRSSREGNQGSGSQGSVFRLYRRGREGRPFSPLPPGGVQEGHLGASTGRRGRVGRGRPFRASQGLKAEQGVPGIAAHHPGLPSGFIRYAGKLPLGHFSISWHSFAQADPRAPSQAMYRRTCLAPVSPIVAPALACFLLAVVSRRLTPVLNGLALLHVPV